MELLSKLRIDPEREDWTKITMDWGDFAAVRSAATKIQQEKIMTEKFGITDYEWSDLDPQFTYRPEDVPIMDLKGKVRIRVSRYRALDSWVGVIRSRTARRLKRKLDHQLKAYCQNTAEEPGQKCKVGEICFVKVPSFDEIDKMMEGAFGKKRWDKRRKPELRVAKDDRLAGWWVRAVCEGISKCGQFGDFTDVDTGRYFPANWINCRRAVFRYLTAPASAFRCTLLLTNPFQVTQAVHEKWKVLMKRGQHFRFNLLGITPDETLLLRLSKPTEDEMDARYKKSLGDQPDPSEDRNSPLYNPPDAAYERKGLFF